MKTTDPAAMTEAERFTEIAELLAHGIQRHFANECKSPTTAENPHVGLDALGAVAAPCGSHVLNPKSMEPTR